MTSLVDNPTASGAANPATLDAHSIPAPGHGEAAVLAQREFQRFVAVLESLSPEDWDRPTACPLWSVRQVVAHVTGAAAAFSSWASFLRQGSPSVQRPYRERGMSQLDAMNQIQVDDRADRTPAQLLSELREVGPRAIATRRRLPLPLRALRVPLPPLGGWVAIGYLTDVIYPRDMWLHRFDICCAANRPKALDSEHDGRLTALVMRDLERTRDWRAALGSINVVYHLTGPAGGTWRFGRAREAPAVELTLDALQFHLLASGRRTVNEIAVEVAGDSAVAARALSATTVPY
ncbi:MAG: maleylpyruvate isomerase family mycothiol-dependent enzyme [Chloroflexi bacterium]|nr:maleylpyruvate isomerase family mycothiol-dependent enzyme [Chloroflexota bacterium]MBV9546883.1 maleylpyruvate isomerase family mycothiol-dependent enzyme [Chloroflexota bacterium]